MILCCSYNHYAAGMQQYVAIAALYHQTTPSPLFPFSNNPQLQNVSQLRLMQHDLCIML